MTINEICDNIGRGNNQLLSLELLEKILSERKKQRIKFLRFPLSNNSGSLRIALEELGEAAKALNKRLPVEEFQKEMLQCACVILAHLDGDLHDGNI